ncbi:MAG: RNA 2',3'-cyclic phosphodiesterase [Hyphomicrobiaceae bacterium]
MPRLFTAIELPDEIIDHLSDLQQPLPGARWIDPGDFHITLRFAGDIDGRAAREFRYMLAQIEVDAFELRLETLGTFGGNDPRAVWAGVSLNPDLEALARANERAARAAGLAPETRAYKPHVTLARLRNTPPEIVARYLQRIGAFRSEPFVVTRFVLLSSKPRVGGGPYVEEESYPLRGGWDQAGDDDLLDGWR